MYYDFVGREIEDTEWENMRKDALEDLENKTTTTYLTNWLYLPNSKIILNPIHIKLIEHWNHDGRITYHIHYGDEFPLIINKNIEPDDYQAIAHFVRKLGGLL